MRARAIKDLAQLSDSDFFISVADGLGLIMKNVNRLYQGASALGEQNQGRAARVLSTIAEEEAAKFLILMDAVRCPKTPGDRFSNQLGRFNDHLAKGLYARACGMRPTTAAELQTYIDNERDEFYLDGPNDVDWIFRNEVIQGREGALYVDYVAYGDEHRWSDPTDLDEVSLSVTEPAAVKMARTLSDAGVSSGAALAVVADLWRVTPLEATTNVGEIRRMTYRTLESLDAAGLLKVPPEDAYRSIVREWQFPMYDLDLKQVAVNLDALRERQRNWSPDWF